MMIVPVNTTSVWRMKDDLISVLNLFGPFRFCSFRFHDTKNFSYFCSAYRGQCLILLRLQLGLKVS